MDRATPRRELLISKGWVQAAILVFVFGFFVLAHTVTDQISFQIALFIFTFSALVGAVSFLPGGVGTAEAAMIALLLLNDLDRPTAIALTVLFRVVTLWFSIALGVLGYLVCTNWRVINPKTHSIG